MSSDSGFPDRGLIVKCKFDNARKRISFRSLQNCTFAELKRKVDRGFSLYTTSYTIYWQDDDGEKSDILSDDDLNEAIRYFCPTVDDAPSSSGSSIFSSLGRGKDVVMHVSIVVDYDGPNLSDTSSLASLDEYRSRNGSLRSFSFGGSQPLEPDDDSVTVSSKDHTGSSGSSYSQGRPIASSSRHDYSKVSPTVRYPNHLSPSDSISVLNERPDDASQFSFREIGDLASSQSSIPDDDELSHAHERYPADPSAVFERLKIREALGEDLSDWDGSEEDRGARWLREQSSRARLPGLPESPTGSSEDDDFDCLSLERNNNGIYYYNYTDGSQSHPDDARSRALSDDDHGIQGSSTRVERPRPTSMHIDWVLAQQHELEESDRRKASASQLTLPSERSVNEPKPKYTPIQEDTSFDLRYYNLPGPPPDIVTDCSNCGVLLEVLRYVCTTCGEKPPANRRDKGKQVDDSDSCSSPTYPPSMTGSSTGSHRSCPSQTLAHSTENLLTGPRKLYHNLVDGQSFSSSLLSPFSRPEPPAPVQTPAPAVQGYELCPVCLEAAGNVHAIDAALDSPSSGTSAFGGSTASLAQDPTWRTAALKKGRVRHAYAEKVWGEFGWENIGHDESLVSVCSICSANTETQRYKCAVCPNFSLCSGCFTVVHLIHPADPFLLVPDKPTFNKPSIESLVANHLEDEEELSMEHRVTCAHCLMPIVGALFHCAFCESVDICSNCEAAGLPGNLESVEGGHNSSHILLKIPYVMEPSQLRKASKAAMRRWRGRDSMIAFSASRAASEGARAETIIGGKAASSYPESPDDHDVPCSSCQEPIIGLRFQCCHCPSYPTAYNLCEKCEKRSWAVHDPMHAFFKLPRPVRVALQSRAPFLPLLYEVPAGPPPNTNVRSDDPEEYLNYLCHWVVRCDLCVETIQGAWYRCAYCSKDLCHQCQTVDVHAPDHVFVVFKSTVELSSFRDWTSVENPKPIIDHPIY